MEEVDDRKLVRRIGLGDREALEAFHARHAAWMTLRLRRRCRDPEIVAEVLQETLLAVWRDRERLRRARRSSWLGLDHRRTEALYFNARNRDWQLTAWWTWPMHRGWGTRGWAAALLLALLGLVAYSRRGVRPDRGP